MLLRLIFFSIVALAFLIGFLFHLKNEQMVLVDYIFGKGIFKVSWVVLVSMAIGSIVTAFSFLPAYFRNIAAIWRLKRENKKSVIENGSEVGADDLF